MSCGHSDPLNLLKRAAESEHGPLFIHYSCGLGTGDPGQKPISFISVLPEGSPTEIFDAYIGDEEGLLRRFAQFVSRHANRVWIGWRFLRQDFGFPHIAARYTAIVGGEMKTPPDAVDLKDQIMLKFGSDFADHPKLENAAKLNRVSMLGMLTPDEAAAAYEAGDWPKLRTNTNRKVAVIRTLFYKAVRGEFKTRDRKQEAHGEAAATELARRSKANEANERMKKMILADPEAAGWSSPRWSRELKCARSTVTATKTWKSMTQARLKAKAERLTDRRRNLRAYKNSNWPD